MDHILVLQPNGKYAIYNKVDIDFGVWGMSRSDALITMMQILAITESLAYAKVREADLNRGRFEQCMSNILETKNGRASVWEFRSQMQFTE